VGGLGGPGWFEGARDFSVLRNVQTGFGAHSAPYLIGTGGGGGLSPGVKRPGLEADN